MPSTVLSLGGVADFFSLHAFGFYWYVFNIADVAIVAGVIGLIYDSLRPSRKDASKASNQRIWKNYFRREGLRAGARGKAWRISRMSFARWLAGGRDGRPHCLLSGCGADGVDLNGKVFDWMGISPAARSAQVRAAGCRARSPGHAAQLRPVCPQPGSGRAPGVADLAGRTTPRSARRREAKERERLHLAYCRGEVQWKEKALNKENVGAPAAPMGRAPRCSAALTVNEANRRAAVRWAICCVVGCCGRSLARTATQGADPLGPGLMRHINLLSFDFAGPEDQQVPAAAPVSQGSREPSRKASSRAARRRGGMPSRGQENEPMPKSGQSATSFSSSPWTHPRNVHANLRDLKASPAVSRVSEFKLANGLQVSSCRTIARRS